MTIDNRTAVSINTRIAKKRGVIYKVRKYRYLFLLMLPGIIYFIVFRYLPIGGILLAFKEFEVDRGYLFSPWAGLKYFKRMIELPDVSKVVLNTLKISILKIIFGFPAPIILTLLINELRMKVFKKTVQTIFYMPYFISWVVVAGLITEVLSPSRGIYGIIVRDILGREPQLLLTSKTWFVPILIVSDIWKGVGYGTVIYLATLSNISPELYESAQIDGAGRFKQIRYITIPGLIPVMSILLILSMGSILNAGFDQIYNLYNSLVFDVADIISTYVYRVAFGGFEYSFSTAVGLTKNIVAFILVMTANKIASNFTNYTIW